MPRGIAKATDRFERKRDAILDAATALMNAKGVKGLTLSEAAAAVGLSTTSVTYYFKRKDELAAACMLRGIAELDAIAQQAVAEPEPADRLRRLLLLYLERLERAEAGDAPPLPILADLRALNPPPLEQVFNAYMKLFRRVRQVFEAPALDWLTRGRRTARTEVLLEQIFWLPGWLRNYPAAERPRLAERMLDVLIDGMARPGAAWAPASLPMAELVAQDVRGRAQETFLLAATRLINARGYRGASVEKISAELKVTKGSFYHHNEAKDDLVTACFERNFEVMRRAQALAAAQQGDGWLRLSTAAAALAEFQLSSQGPLLRAAALSVLPEAMRMKVWREASRVTEGFQALIAAGVADGSLRPVDPIIAAQMLHATLDAGSELPFFVPGVKPKAAPAVFVRPMLMGIFAP